MTMSLPTGTREADALALDRSDPLAAQRDRFRLPIGPDGEPAIYLAGQSLGAQPRAAAAFVEAELEAWARLGVEGHFHPGAKWVDYDEPLREPTARIVGALPGEVVTMNTLTVNLHVLLASFYRPVRGRSAILIDGPTFPSDRYAVDSQIRLHGLDPEEERIVARPRDGEATLRADDIEALVHEHRDRLAVVLLAGVNYATGQRHDVERLTAAGHAAGALVGWDLAHSAGNVPLRLHDWGVDFAAWCTYKYLNGGPGAIGGAFVHDRHGRDAAVPRLSGWWGNDPATRFAMAPEFAPAGGADGWRISNVPILSVAPLRASLAIFDEVGMDALRAKSVRLTGFLEGLITGVGERIEIITPSDPEARGCQLSLRIRSGARELLDRLSANGVVADFREPDIIRVAPVPLYNTFHDAWRFARILAEAG